MSNELIIENEVVDLRKGDFLQVGAGKFYEVVSIAIHSKFVEVCWTDGVGIGTEGFSKDEEVSILNASRHSEGNHLMGGVIKEGDVFDYFNTIHIVDSSGYKIDLLLRLQELVLNYGNKVSVRYWITDKPVSFLDAQTGAIQAAMGMTSLSLNADEYSYSEMTSGVEYSTDMMIGGHDLYKRLASQNGKHLWIEFSFSK